MKNKLLAAVLLILIFSVPGCNWFTLNCPSHTPGTPPVCTATGG